MLDLLTGFVAELRAAGIPVSLTEHLDAAEVLRHIPMEDREAMKYALGASLVKTSSHWRAYETAFEIYFSLRGPEYRIEDEPDADQASPTEPGGPAGEGDRRGQGRGTGGGGHDGMTPEELADLLYKALLGANSALVAAVARQAVTRYAGMEAGRPVGGTYYLYRTLRNLDLEGVLDRLLDEARSSTSMLGDDGAGGGAPRPRSPPWRSGCSVTSTSRASISSARRSRTRSAAGWWRTGGARRWPSRSASRCPRTST